MQSGLRYRWLFCIALVLAGTALLRPGPGLVEAADWAERLSGADPEAIHDAIVEIGQKQDATAASLLIDTALRARFPHLAVACGDALAQMSAKDLQEKLLSKPSLLAGLQKLIRGRAETEKLNLARLLGAWGHPFVDEPLASLCAKRHAEDVRVEALFMSGALVGELGAFPLTEAAIAKALKDRQSKVLCAACSALGRRKLKGHEKRLLKMVASDKLPLVGMYAVRALERLAWRGGIKPFTPGLVKRTKKGGGQAALKAIVRLSGPADAQVLLKLSSSPSAMARDAALLALGRLAQPTTSETGKESAAPTLKELIPSLPNPTVDVSPKLLELILQRFMAVVAKERDFRPRDAARQGLLRYGERAQEAVAATMAALTRSSIEDIALDAMELCGRFKIRAAYEGLTKIVRNEKDRTRRVFAARAMEGIDAKRAADDLAESVARAGRKSGRRIKCLEALGYVRHREAFDFLVAFLEGESTTEPALAEAERSLERLTGHRFGRHAEHWRTWIADRQSPFNPRETPSNRAARRSEVREKKAYGITKATEKSVEAGLRWLESAQLTGGNWVVATVKSKGASHAKEAASTGGGLLAFLGGGYGPGAGKYRVCAARALEWLRTLQQYDGGFGAPRRLSARAHFPYADGLAIWALPEALSVAPSKRLAEDGLAGLGFLSRTQARGAGWRYSPHGDEGDTSCTVWVLMALKAGERAGLYVDQKCWDGVDFWLRECSSDVTGREEAPADLSTDYEYEVGSAEVFTAGAGYQPTGSSAKRRVGQTASMTAAAMTARLFMGWERSHPFLIGSANYLAKFPPDWTASNRGCSSPPCYYAWYYGTLAMHQSGGRNWREWNKHVQAMYPKHQRAEPAAMAGSWEPRGRNIDRQLATVFSVLTLETYYRYSPLMTRSEGPEKDSRAGASK